MALDLLAGLAQGYGMAQQRKMEAQGKEELNKLQVKLFKQQLEEKDKASAALGQLTEMLAGSTLPPDQAGPQKPGMSLKDVMSSPEGQSAALGAGYKINDIRQFQQPGIAEMLAQMQTSGALGGGLKLTSLKIGPDGQMMPDFGLPEYSLTADRERAKADVARATEDEKKNVKAGNMSDLINEADKLLDTATGSYLGKGLSIGKRAVGFSDDTTKANQRLELISGWLVSNVPRMEGPQSNFDVQNYQTMAGMVGDSTVPIGDRRAALKTLLELQKKYTTNQSMTSEKPSLKGPGKADSDPLGIR